MYAIVQEIYEENFVDMNHGDELEDTMFELNEYPMILIKLETRPSQDVLNEYPLLRGQFMVNALDLINYTILGEIDGNVLFEYTRSHNLPIYNIFYDSIIPNSETTSFVLNMFGNGENLQIIYEKKKQLLRHCALYYNEIFNEILRDNRKFRWLIHFRKVNEI